MNHRHRLAPVLHSRSSAEGFAPIFWHSPLLLYSFRWWYIQVVSSTFC
jgi:hypothetical protein